MSATPIIPGHLYRVKSAGFDLQIIATSGCDAIAQVLRAQEGALA